MGPDLNFVIPKDREELIGKFLCLSKDAQEFLLIAMKLGAEQSGKQGLLKQIDALRTDPRTREIVARLESASQNGSKKPKPQRWRERLLLRRKQTP